MEARALVAALLLLALAAPAAAQRQYVRDEIRVNMRAGPGLQFKILHVLRSGDTVRRIASQDDWVLVRLSDGGEGWVPAGYLTPEVPPSVLVPELQEQLNRAETRVDELETQIASQSDAIGELEDLRVMNEALQQENSELAFSSGWKSMATGAGILLVGMLIGVLSPSRSRSAGRKIKL